MKHRILTAFLMMIITFSFAISIHSVFAIYDDWTHRTVLTIDHTKIDSDLTNFPVYLQLSDNSGLTSTDFSVIFDEIGANYTQLLITTNEYESCYVEVVNWNNLTETAELWVKVPIIYADFDTILYLFYGADHPPNYAYVGLSGSNVAEQVWDSNYVMIQHLNDNPDTTATIDSTENDNDGTKTGADEPIETTGIIGKGQNFDGSNDYINFGNALNNFDEMTIEMWLNTTTIDGTYRDVVNKGWQNTGSFLIYVQQPSVDRCYFATRGSGAGNIAVGININENENNYVVASFKRNTKNELSVNAGSISLSSSVTEDETFSLSANIVFGGSSTDYKGLIDEIRLSNIRRSSAWINACYETEIDNLLTIETPTTETQTSPLMLFGLLGFIFAFCAMALLVSNKKG